MRTIIVTGPAGRDLAKATVAEVAEMVADASVLLSRGMAAKEVVQRVQNAGWTPAVAKRAVAIVSQTGPGVELVPQGSGKGAERWDRLLFALHCVAMLVSALMLTINAPTAPSRIASAFVLQAIVWAVVVHVWIGWLIWRGRRSGLILGSLLLGYLTAAPMLLRAGPVRAYDFLYLLATLYFVIRAVRWSEGVFWRRQS